MHRTKIPLPFNPDIHRRRSVRLKDWDYSTPGAYFVTICTSRRECLFGEVVAGDMRLNQVGEIVHDEWLRTPNVRPNVDLDAFVVMPNHAHVLFHINQFGVGATRRVAPTTDGRVLNGPKPGSVGAIIGQFKPRVTKRTNILRDTPGAPVWQRSFYDHIVRTQSDLERIRRYISENPIKWHLDLDNPDNW